MQNWEKAFFYELIQVVHNNATEWWIYVGLDYIVTYISLEYKWIIQIFRKNCVAETLNEEKLNNPL